MKGTTEIGNNGKRLPKDVKIIGGLGVAIGLYCILVAVCHLPGIVTPTQPVPDFYYMLGVIHIESNMGYVIANLTYGVIGIVGGLGLMRGRPWAWWLQWLLFLTVIPNYYIRFMFDGSVAIGWKVSELVLEGAFALWLVFRARIYKPFGQKKETVVPPEKSIRDEK